jgi:hypothetical protein
LKTSFWTEYSIIFLFRTDLIKAISSWSDLGLFINFFISSRGRNLRKGINAISASSENSDPEDLHK